MANQKIVFIAIFFIIGSVVSGCGGGGSGGSESVGGEPVVGEPLPTKILSWNSPATYQDGSSLNPETDLDRFEIYVKETSNFADTDDEMAAVSANDKATGQIITSFNLANLSPFISEGVTYYVSIRAVAKSGLKSGFSPSAGFSF